MAPFDSAEIVRQPLDALILRLRTMLGAETAVVPVLQDVIEPPSIENIDSSFRSVESLTNIVRIVAKRYRKFYTCI